MIYKRYVKRSIDIFISLMLLMITSFLLLATCVVLSIQNRGSPFFIQRRPGLHQKPFRIVKFKTMNDAKNESGALLQDSDRLTRVGMVIRKLSIDELPQLWNVLKGDMSLVGPRPLLMRYLRLYTHTQLRRHEVRPGITGYAQVNGRNLISWKEKFEHDLYYVDNMTFLLDMQILWRTLHTIISRKGVDQCESETMTPFNGNN